MIILLFVLRNNLVLFFVLKIIFNIAQWSLRLAKNFTCLPGDKLSPGRILILDRVFAFSLDSQLDLMSQLMLQLRQLQRSTIVLPHRSKQNVSFCLEIVRCCS